MHNRPYDGFNPPPGSRYKLDAGRCIVRDGIPIATLHKVRARFDITSDSQEYTLDPSEADDFAHEVIAALNNYEATKEARAIIEHIWEED